MNYNMFLYEEPLTVETLAIPVYTPKANDKYANPDNCTLQSMEAMCASVARSKFTDMSAPILKIIRTIPLDSTSYVSWAKSHKFTDTAVATQFAYARNATDKQSLSLWKSYKYMPVIKVCTIAIHMTDGIPPEKLDNKLLKALTGIIKKIPILKKCRIFIPAKICSSERLYKEIHKHHSEAAKAFDIKSQQATMIQSKYEPQMVDDFFCIPIYVLEPNVLEHHIGLLYSTHSDELKLDKNNIESIFQKYHLNATLVWEYIFPAYAIPAVFTMTHLVDSDAFYDVAALSTRVCLAHAKDEVPIYINFAPYGDTNKTKVVKVDNPADAEPKEKVMGIVDAIKQFILNDGGFVHIDVNNHVVGYAIEVLGGIRPMSADDASRTFNYTADEHNDPVKYHKTFGEDADYPALEVSKEDVHQ